MGKNKNNNKKNFYKQKQKLVFLLLNSGHTSEAGSAGSQRPTGAAALSPFFYLHRHLAFHSPNPAALLWAPSGSLSVRTCLSP